MEPNRENGRDYDNSESNHSENESQRASQDAIPQDANGGLETDAGTVDGYNSSPEDKYLAIEQPGVTYTAENDEVLLNSDNLEDRMEDDSDVFDPLQKNTRNADAFGQDEYMLDQNIDLDEDGSKSISSDDDTD